MKVAFSADVTGLATVVAGLRDRFESPSVSGELPSSLILYFYSLFSVLLYYILTGSISTDCDHYGHSHVM
jgi:hypothetical protein